PPSALRLERGIACALIENLPLERDRSAGPRERDMVVVAEVHGDRADDRRTLRCNVGSEQRLPAAHGIERSSVVIGIGILAAGEEPSGAAVGIVKISAEKGDAVLTFDEKAAAALGRIPPPADLGGGVGDQGAQREPSADK